MEPVAHVRPGFVALALRRRWRILTVAALLGLLAGTAVGMTMSVSYSSEASLFLNPIAGNPYQPEIGTARNDQLVALQTEGTLIATPEVAALAQTLSPVALPEAAERHVKVSAPSNSQVIRVSFSAGRPEVATAGAQAFADAYLEYRRQRGEQANQAKAGQLQEQLDATNTVIGQTATALASTTEGSSDELLLQQQLQVYSSQLAQLRLQLTEVLSAVPSTGEVISPATPAPKPSGLPIWVIAVAGMCGAFGLALLYVLAREHGDDRVHDAQELSGLGVGHPLATVPAGVSAHDLSRASPEGYRLLLTVLMGRDAMQTPVVCVLGSDGSGASTSVAAGIAAAAHRLGRRALVVGPDVDRLWDGSRALSIDNVLEPAPRGSAPAVLRLGPSLATAEEVALSPALPDALVRARHTFDLVVLAGRTGTSALGWRFAALADRTMVVGALGEDNFTELLDLVETLLQSGVEDVGVVAATRTRGEDGRRRPRARRAAKSQPAPTTGAIAETAVQPVATVGDQRAAPGTNDISNVRREVDQGILRRIPRPHVTAKPAPPVGRLADRRAGR